MCVVLLLFTDTITHKIYFVESRNNKRKETIATIMLDENTPLNGTNHQESRSSRRCVRATASLLTAGIFPCTESLGSYVSGKDSSFTCGGGDDDDAGLGYCWNSQGC